MTPIPRRELIAALAGEDVCPHCRGDGKIRVTGPRDHRVCPPCRGSGRLPPRGTTAAYELWLDARSARKAAREIQR